MNKILSSEVADNTNKYPWAYKLGRYSDHPILEMFKDFEGYNKQLIDCSFIYLGYYTKNNRKESISIWHYHTSFEPLTRFMDMQNLKCYSKLDGVPKLEQNKLALEIDRAVVIDLKYPDALTFNMLDFIGSCKKFFLCDELGNVTEYNWGWI